MVTLMKLKLDYEHGANVNEEPLVWVFENFLTSVESEHLLDAADSRLQRALVSSAASGVESAGRSGRNCWLKHNHSELTEQILSRVALLVNLPRQNAESFQVVHYGENQEYAPHFDAWDASTERGMRCMEKGGQRLLTCLFYLNDVSKGGGTCFPKLDLEVQAKKGRMLLFYNCHSESIIRHPYSLHAGLPVSKGEKWACNLWFRERTYQMASGSKAPTRFGRVI